MDKRIVIIASLLIIIAIVVAVMMKSKAPTSKKISVTWNAGVEASPTWISATINYPASDKGVLAVDSGERVFVDGQYKQLLIQKVTVLNRSNDNITASIGVTPIIPNQPAWSTSSSSNPVTIDLTSVGNLLIPTLSNNYYANKTSITIEGTVS